MVYLRCKKCNWLHFGVSETKAIQDVQKFNEYYNKLSDEEKKAYNGILDIETYKKCFKCRTSYENMKIDIMKPEENGSTIQPIIYHFKI